jgi:hypothetical protein
MRAITISLLLSLQARFDRSSLSLSLWDLSAIWSRKLHINGAKREKVGKGHCDVRIIL